MRNFQYTPLVVLLARLILSATFILAALPKIKDPIAFTAAIEGFQVITGTPALWLAIGLPWLELVIGIGLLVPAIKRTSGVLISCLLIVFISLHASAWQRGLDISCGCFGAESEPTANYSLLILRNLLLLAAMGLVLFKGTRPSANASDIAI